MLAAALLLAATLGSCTIAALQQPLLCKSQSQPNPIASIYPDQVTGTINGTLSVLPIPLAEAQQIVGPKYAILTAAYRELLPDFPHDMYPAIIQALHDHDLQAPGIRIPDFTRISIEYPFLDLLNNSYSSFRLALNQTITDGSPALAGSAAYGTNVYPATFNPPCDAYGPGTSLTAYPVPRSPNASENAYFATSFAPAPCPSPYPLSFFVNATNQPSFADPARGCDRMVRLFNTSVTQPPYEPVDVYGTVWASQTFFPTASGNGRTWEGVWGVRLDTAFIEYNYLPCESLAGVTAS